MKFSHLHVHTQFSLLDGAADISKLYKKAIKDEMPALAITDHGNMFGAFAFVAEAYKHKHADGSLKVKPIVGCEFYVVQDRHKRNFTRDDKDQRSHQLLLAKNEIGYQNLIKLCSLGYIEGLYGKYPRIDKELIKNNHEGLIATTCCLAAIVPRTILRKGEVEGEKEFKWWLDLFGEDYYIELQRHGIPDQDKVNEILLKWAEKYNVKVIATNDSHYVEQEDANMHDILLCINTGEKLSTPKNIEFTDDDTVSKGKRFAFANDQFYFKTTEEMTQVFSDVPYAIDNTNEIVDKVNVLNLKKEVLLPNYEIPRNFSTQDEYLRHLTFEGAHRRYESLTPEIEERLNFELLTIKTMGFAGYFLIVADFIQAGRDIGVWVGPGRGSAAGSAVAYCIGITNIDPIKYNLLFERFLNPERKSLPDIDTDFDDSGRQKVIDYVVQKYGKNQVAQIITYGTIAAKSSIKDVARVMDLPLNESNALSKLVPSKPGTELSSVLHAPLDGDSVPFDDDDIENVKAIREIYAGSDLRAQVLHEAERIEGSIRGTGVHAAGIIIAPKNLMEIVPLAVAKDSELLVSQYEGNTIEEAGVIKMDFLGLKNLSIIKNVVRFIKENHGIELNIDNIPLDDKETYEKVFQKGETNGIFQFESLGMQKYLKDLKPDKFDDLVAMNALFRPGPIKYIPEYINRKHKRSPITYDLPEMAEYLEPTYGITVFQEQVMLLSQKLANFSKGEADLLRKAMGKKDRKGLDEKKGTFIQRGIGNGHPADILEKIWTDWEAFASYAFNKSHSVSYAYVAFHTGYLKTHYPSEFLAASLENARNSIDEVAFFMEECKRMHIPVLGPNINQSEMSFSVNKKGEIRFGLSGIKGVGEAAVEVIIAERKLNGPYKSIFDLTKRVNLRSVNKKTLEALVYAGAFDCFEGSYRAQYFANAGDESNMIERAIRFGNAVQSNANANQQSLFGSSNASQIPEPILPTCEDWSLMEKLHKEKEMIGIYLSGHPLDPFQFDIKHFCNYKLSDLQNISNLVGKEIRLACMITSANHSIAKNGNPFGSIQIEDYSSSMELSFWRNDYVNFRKFLEKDYFIFIKGKVDHRFGKAENPLEFKVQHIEMLADIREKLTSSIVFQTNVEDINTKYIQTLKNLVETHKGNANIAVEILGSGIELFSRKFRINLSNEVLELINDNHLNYRIQAKY